MSVDAPRLYDLCINVAVADCVTVCKFCKKEFRILPDNVLFDFYHKMYLEKRLCLLGVEFSELDVFIRMLKIKHKRTKLLKSFQSLIEHGSNILDELVTSYGRYTTNGQQPTESIINIGFRLAGFFNEGAWYSSAIEVLNMIEQLHEKLEHKNLAILLDCYQRRIMAEAIYCQFAEAKKTYKLALNVVDELSKTDTVPNLAGIYSHFSMLFYIRSEYDKAYSWATKAIGELNEDLPPRIIIDVLRYCSKSCVVKRRFAQAGLLIRQAVAMAIDLYKDDDHPHYSNTLMDYGFYLLNFDSIKESVKVYERALSIRKEVFEKNNIMVATAYEDLAYALYVNEYSSGRFYSAREAAEKSIRIREKILPKDHILLASSKRVKALILEEIALDMRDTNNEQVQDLLYQAEELHKHALALSRRTFGENNVQTAKHYGNLGRLYQTMTQYEKAEKMHLKAIAIKEHLLGPDDYEVGLSVGHLASLYNYHMSRHKDAEKLYLRSIDINLKLFGETYSGLEYDYRGLIHVYTEEQNIDKMRHYRERMRNWMATREHQRVVVVYPKNGAPLKEVIDRFYKLC